MIGKDGAHVGGPDKPGHRDSAILESTFASFDDALFVVDSRTRVILRCNDAVKRIFGYGTGEVVGRNTEFLHVDHEAYVRFGKEMFAALDAEGVFRTEFRVRRKNGEVFVSEHTVTQILDDAGRRVAVVSVVRDIDDQVKVREESRLHSAVLHNMFEGVCLIRAGDARIIHANPRFEKMFGYGPGEMNGLPVTVLNHPNGDKDALRVAEDIIAQLERNGAAIYEVLNVRKDRTPFWCRASTSVFNHPEHGKVWVAVHEDITERKRLEAEVALRQQQMSAFFEGATAGLALMDRDLRFLQINDTLAAINGVPVREHLGRTVHDVLPAFVHIVEPIIQRVFATGKPVLDIEVSGETPKEPGVQRHWLESFFPVPGGDGRIEAVGAVVVEITERKQAEEALRESEARYHALFENSLDAILLTVPDGRILSANPAACRMFGGTEAEICTLGRSGLVDTSDPRLPGALEERRRAGRFSGELTYVRRDGTRFPGEVSTVVYADRHGESRTSMMIRDISKRRCAEEELARSQQELRLLANRLAQAEEAERRRISLELHDQVGQRVSIIGVDLGVVRALLPEGVSDKVLDRLDEASDSAEEIGRRIRNVMEDLRPTELDDYGLLPALQGYAGRFTDRTGIPVEVLGNPDGARGHEELRTALFRIAQEALTNVGKHAKAAKVTVRLEPMGEGVRMSISDDGRGFDASAVKDVAPPRGGLGLIGMRERAAAVGATCRVESQPGRGTRVVVEWQGEPNGH